MEPEKNNKTQRDFKNPDENVSFSSVTVVATGWMLDFLFVSLCRRLKEGKLDEFNESLSAFDAIYKSSNLRGSLLEEKRLICAFITRVMHGKQLDVRFEEDDDVMPLMSAANVWSRLKDSVTDESLLTNMPILLHVQSVAVCLEKGQRSSATSVLKWFEINFECQQNLQVKLSRIVAEGDSYHPFLINFSFKHLLDTVQTYLDGFLEKNPSDYLLKAATNMVQSLQNSEDSEDSVTRDNTQDDTTSDSTQKEGTKNQNSARLRTKRKLLSTKTYDVFKPETCKKPVIHLRRITPSELSQWKTENEPDNTSTIKKTRKPHQKWTAQLDKNLKDGVRRHGQGKWALILQDYDFEGRTGTMLKDRWRILAKAHAVG
ncbi:telomeric repeat-binding factor 1 [Thalassophryne amazonica]|uniref:telomeric repeat-binding factor 1 n=1 Tax=Thalassophryne amazonica TaxID=390379 RepID=UPI001471FC1B|nr:telomeric repeat-binding factor 1 [Thalassophryne amazonica]